MKPLDHVKKKVIEILLENKQFHTFLFTEYSYLFLET